MKASISTIGATNGRGRSDGTATGVGPQKNQLRQVRGPTGAECRILRARRPAGSDVGKLPARGRSGQWLPRRKLRKSARFLRGRRPDRGKGTSVRPRRHDLVHEAFAPGGALAATLPGFEARREQAALAEAVGDALARGEHLLAEAGTGTGKTLAYVIPALESGQRVVVATATRALQEQLLGKDVPAAARALGREVDVVVLKGRQNYVCRKQLSTFGPMLLRDARDEEAFEALEPWLAETETGDRAELPFEPSEALWSELAVGSDRCAGRALPVSLDVLRRGRAGARGRGGARDREPCPLLRRRRGGRRRAAGARRRRLRRGAPARGDGGLLARRAGLARGLHRLGARRRARAAARRTRRCRRGALDRVATAGDRLLRAVVARGRAAPAARDPGRDCARPRRCARRARGRARGRGPRGSTSSRRRALAVAAQVEACLEPGELERVVWAEPDALAWAPVDVSRELRERLWGEGPTAILVSATLTTGEDARFVRRRLGLERRARARGRVAVRLPRAGAAVRPADDARPAERGVHAARRRGGACAPLALARAGARAHVELPRRSTCCATLSRAACRTTCSSRETRRASGCSSGSGRGRLGAARDLDVLAGRRRPGRVAVAARDRQAAVLGARRPAARGALRGRRGGGRRLVPRLRAAHRDAPAPAGLRPADPQPRGRRRRRDPRPAAAHARLRPRVPRGAPALSRSSTTAPRWPRSSAERDRFRRRSLRKPLPGWRNWQTRPA